MFRQVSSVQMFWLIASCFCGAVSAQNPSLQDVYLYGGASGQMTMGVSALSGNVYLAGYHELGRPDRTIVLKIDGTDGSLGWWSSQESTTILYSLLAGTDQVFVVGYVVPTECGASDGVGDTEGKSLFAAYDTTSSSRTVCATHNYYPYRGWELYEGLAQMTEGSATSYYAAGMAEQWGFGGHRYLVASYDSLGSRLNYAVDPTTFSWAHAVAVDSGSVYVAGFRRNSSSGLHPELPFAVKLDSGLSAESWRQTLDAAATGAEARFSGVAAEGDAVYAVGEWLLASGNCEYLAARLDATSGGVVWQQVFGGSGDERLEGVVVHNGRVFAVGDTSTDSSGGLDGVLFELDPNDGGIVFQELYGGSHDDSYVGIAVDGDDLWIGGWSDSFATPEGNFVGERDMMLVHYSLSAYIFGGFLPPVNPDGFSVFKSGRVIPLKFRLYLPNGEIAPGAIATLTISKISEQVLGTDLEIYPEPAGGSNTGNTFRFDSECECYIYNLSTQGYSAGTYSARVTLDDGWVGEVMFSIR